MSEILKYISRTWNIKKLVAILSMFILFLTSGFPLFAQQQRFPKPEFESGYTQPVTSMPEARSDFFAIFDVLVLIVALSLISWLILKKRSRRGVLAVSVFSILYFGFFREGCICSVGSLQNVTLALFQPEYSIPISALAFFVIPLVYTLFFGRTFCAGVCPLGAIQDVLLLRPVTMKRWLQKVLGLIPYIYLGLSVLYAATATDFIICRYDPFVGIYRFDATFFMFAIGAIFLLLSIYVARPYCRFFCPYGVLLNWMSRFSKHHLTITPNKCIQCRLCEDSCPLGAINKPVPVKVMEDRQSATKRFISLSLIIPLLMVLGGWTLSNFHENLAKVNPKVRLANELMSFKPDVMLPSVEIEAFKSAGTPLTELYSQAAIIIEQFYIGAWILGAFLGLVFGLTLSSLSVFKYREDYTPDKGECVSCARCLKYCPVEK
ncbi:4Fe-4S binding protein [Ancylomarina salipaludis]|uniref:4Fe-4S binding protein n=1 Tax=Ancylomarina salipaludis TaxID=2501299 RepID=A0A4Q1JIZ7_9BACT|nr:4Fe-4S binding protein [Ancylomarina salipaludis]RXQ89870.1 4Fe-4S binding protein [Ancylomarina salipaludis]